MAPFMLAGTEVAAAAMAEFKLFLIIVFDVVSAGISVLPLVLNTFDH